MARSQITVTSISRSGTTAITQTTSDSTNDHYFINDGKTFIECISSDAGAQTLEIVASPDYTADGLTVSNLTVYVGAGATVCSGPFKVATFRQNASNHVYLNPSVSTTLKLRAWSLP